jgi:cytoskeletal protein CcmA (bactofilin family)
VNPSLSVACLIFLACALLTLPLIPAVIELLRPSDAEPLSVIQQHAGEIRYFADSFRAYIHHLAPDLEACRASGAKATGFMPDGAEFLVLGRGEEALTLPLKQQDEFCPLVIASSTDLLLPSETTFSRDIYSRGNFIGGSRNHYRAILAEKDVHLAEASTVTRWTHAVGEFTADSACKLNGRISSDIAIHLRPDCSFLRLNAPRIEIGSLAESAVLPNFPAAQPTGPGISHRRLHDGDFEIASGQVFEGDLVVRGNLRIGSNARVCGSVKSDKELVLESGASITGSLISAGKMTVGPDCSIHGPIISERELHIAHGTHCGSAELPTTVSALKISTEEDVVVFGTLWARERGQVEVN